MPVSTLHIQNASDRNTVYGSTSLLRNKPLRQWNELGSSLQMAIKHKDNIADGKRQPPRKG